MKKIILAIFLLFYGFIGCISQELEKKYAIRTIAFYNLENLFDTINDTSINDEASPIMEIKENKSVIYWDKINKLASVIDKIGRDKTQTSPAIIGVAEVENLRVLEDLVNSKHLKANNYGIIHYNSPDKRGIDVAFLYQKKYFTPVFHEVINPNIYRNNFKISTRDQLLVTGYLDNDLIHIIVNHWPSRRGGEQKSRPLREKAAHQNIKIIAKIREKDPNAKILIMGDFNDDPINTSFKKILKTKSAKNKLQKNDLYNPFENMFKRGFNTLGYRDNLNLFDQIILSSQLLKSNNSDFTTYKFYKAMIFNKRFLTTKKGRFKGYPLRSFSFGNYTGGYSDHYPVYVYLIRQQK